MTAPGGGRPVVAVLDLGRPGALGATRRVETWQDLWVAAGADVTVLRLLPECPAPLLSLPGSAAACLRRNDVALESVAWSWRTAAARLHVLQPDVVVCTTVRSYHPDVAPAGAVVVLDFVDRLSENYSRRATIEPAAWRRHVLRGLARRMVSLETTCTAGVVRTAAGRADAVALGATFVPNVVVAPRSPRSSPDVDALFVGTLDYAPNVDALHRLSRAWPSVQRRRPGCTLLVAGARPGADVRRLAEHHDWELVADFADLDEVCARARVALAPVACATGMQNKVIETAVRGLPQLVHPAVLQGLDQAFPAVVAESDEAFADALGELLQDEERRRAAGAAARRHVLQHYTAPAWSDWCRGLLDRPVACQAVTAR